MASSTRAVTPHKGRGRPRTFDTDTVVDAALLVFRERGYHASSLADLSAATRLTSGSLYKAFADKQAIFLAAFDRYTQQRGERLRQKLDRVNTGREKLRVMLEDYAELSTGAEGRRGCLVVGSAAELATMDPDMAAHVVAALRRVEQQVLGLVELGQADGSIPAELDAAATACTLLCLLQGVRVAGKTGRTGAEMAGVADRAMRLLDR